MSKNITEKLCWKYAYTIFMLFIGILDGKKNFFFHSLVSFYLFKINTHTFVRLLRASFIGSMYQCIVAFVDSFFGIYLFIMSISYNLFKLPYFISFYFIFFCLMLSLLVGKIYIVIFKSKCKWPYHPI